jgi:hypothetical protein
MRTLVLLLTVPSVTAQIYVSPAGNDANSGTEAKPVKTLQRARDLVHSQNSAMTSDIPVRLAAGTYRLSQPLALDERDSGTGGHNVIDTGTSAVISGGLRITGWVAGAKNLWSAPAPAGLSDTRQLYIDGMRASRARAVCR